MSKQNLQQFRARHRGLVAGILQLAVLALTVSMASPLHAADDHAERTVKQRVPPVYPELAKRLHISGVVRISATVAPDGKVSATKTVSGNNMLAGAAEEAVKKWKFEAADSESTVEVSINFAPAQ